VIYSDKTPANGAAIIAGLRDMGLN